MLDIYEALGPHPRGLGHRIEHLGLPSAAQLARAARLGVVAAPQSIFLYELGRNFRDYLPDVLLPRCYPLRAMLDAGVTVALSSDAPVVENDNPLAGITAAVTRRDRAGQPLRAGAGDHRRRSARRLHPRRRRRGRARRARSAPSPRGSAPIWPCCPAIPSPPRPTNCRPLTVEHDAAGRPRRLRAPMTPTRTSSTSAGSGSTPPTAAPGTSSTPPPKRSSRRCPTARPPTATCAIDAAHAAFDGWSRATAYERAAVLDKAAAGIRAGLDDLAHTTVLESGKPLVAGARRVARDRRPARVVRRRGQARLRPGHPARGRRPSGCWC